MDGTLALLTGLLSVAFATAIVGAALFGAYYIGRERGRRDALAGGLALPAAVDPRAEQALRTERALEALALEVERLGEAQRYAARLLGEAAAKVRTDPASPNSSANAPRAATPRTPT